MGDDVVAAIIEEGLESDPSTRSYQLAQEIQNKQTQGQPVTAQELGELYQENVRTVAQEQARQETQEPEGLSLPTVESIQETAAPGGAGDGAARRRAGGDACRPLQGRWRRRGRGRCRSRRQRRKRHRAHRGRLWQTF